ncbi:hypothetical protein WJX81_007021 [Elliptochloris bilobata]|uniref:FAD-binding domain-containing protein n=1 Tax=Elliptochloris bilobata TaxID=381761 RepID=A0AAW1QZZ3_9CHLO
MAGSPTVAPFLKVKVYEKAKGLHPIGACITLPNNATEALESLADGAYERVREAAVRLVAFRRYDALSGDLLGEAKMPATGPGRPLIAIRWYDLQRVLLGCVAPGTVELGCRFLCAEQDSSGGVHVGFEGGAEIRASVLVGCDGNTSAVWDHLFPEDPLQYTGVSVWRTVIPKPADWFELGTAVTWEGDRAIMFTRSMDGFLSLSGLRPWPKERLAEFGRRQYYGVEAGSHDAQGRIERFLEGFSQFPARVVDLVKGIDPATLLEHGIFARPVRAWGRGAITLLGDAAHVMPPNLGQGTGMALEDAHALAAAIGEHGATEAALRTYEAARVPRISHISNTVMEGSFDFYIKGDRAASPMAATSRPGASSIQENGDLSDPSAKALAAEAAESARTVTLAKPTTPKSCNTRKTQAVFNLEAQANTNAFGVLELAPTSPAFSDNPKKNMKEGKGKKRKGKRHKEAEAMPKEDGAAADLAAPKTKTEIEVLLLDDGAAANQAVPKTEAETLPLEDGAAADLAAHDSDMALDAPAARAAGNHAAADCANHVKGDATMHQADGAAADQAAPLTKPDSEPLDGGGAADATAPKTEAEDVLPDEGAANLLAPDSVHDCELPTEDTAADATPNCEREIKEDATVHQADSAAADQAAPLSKPDSEPLDGGAATDAGTMAPKTEAEDMLPAKGTAADAAAPNSVQDCELLTEGTAAAAAAPKLPPAADDSSADATANAPAACPGTTGRAATVRDAVEAAVDVVKATLELAVVAAELSVCVGRLAWLHVGPVTAGLRALVLQV